MEGSKYQDKPLTVSYEISLPTLLVSLYEQRLVLWDEELRSAEWKRRLPELDQIIESLRLNQNQRLEVLRILVDRVTQTTNEVFRQRWLHILTRQEFAVNRIWRRDRKVNGSSDARYCRDWQWENSSWAPMPTQRGNESRNQQDDALALVRPLGKTGVARLRFRRDQYYLRLPLPFGKKSKE